MRMNSKPTGPPSGPKEIPLNPMKRWLAPMVAGLFLTFGAVQAQAASDVYPSDPSQRNFDNGANGYTDEYSQTGICVLSLTCPTVANTYESDGDGTYARTTLGNLSGVQSTTVSSFTSPSFTYNGANGQLPKKLAVRIVRRSDVGSLVEADNNGATYSVDLVNTSGGRSVKVFNDRTLAGFDDFAEIPPAKIDPAELTIGDQYEIQITSRFVTSAQVQPGATVDFDSVRLEATPATKSGGGNGGNGGNNGANGGNGSNGNGAGGNGGNGGNGTNGLEAGGKATIVGHAVLQGKKLLVKVRCAKKPKKRCIARIDGRMTRKGPRATNQRTVRVKAGKTRRVALQVKPKFLERTTASKKLVIKQQTKSGKKIKTTYKKVRITLS
jgi:hypothetical protein